MVKISTRLGYLLQSQRNRAHMSLEGAAAASGLSFPTLSSLERGRSGSRLPVQTAFRLSKGLGIPLDQILAAALADAGTDISAADVRCAQATAAKDKNPRR